MLDLKQVGTKLGVINTEQTGLRPLFSASLTFWACHLAGLTILLLIHTLFWMMFGNEAILDFNLVANGVWFIGFFFGGLLLRQRYLGVLNNDTHSLLLLLKGLLFISVISAIIVLAVMLISFPPFYTEIMEFKRSEEPGIGGLELMSEFFIGNWVQTVSYLVMWAAFYIGITNSRRAKRVELDNLRLQNSLKEARLSNLSNQLNPHFLFNALNNIRFMIQEDSDHAERMLMSLSEVLRYSLESSKQETLSLKQEMEFIQRYIELVKIQFEERLQFEMKIDADLHNAQVPPMILQMLIENAVKHGVERMQQGGLISVTADHTPESLTLTVCNDVPETRHSNSNNTGIGLRNIEQRLHLIYGAAASLHTQIVDQQFCASVKVPRS